MADNYAGSGIKEILSADNHFLQVGLTAKLIS